MEGEEGVLEFQTGVFSEHSRLTDVGEHGEQSDLLKVRALAAHIRPGDDEHIGAIREERVVLVSIIRAFTSPSLSLSLPPQFQFYCISAAYAKKYSG